jgi:cytochrome c-type biogenesis protein CcmH
MTWLFLSALALMLVLPLALVLRAPPAPRDRAEADRALFHAQLAELARERESGRLPEAAYNDAVLEVQRRLLAAPAPIPASSGGRLPLIATLVVVPVLAFGLYLLHGNPGLPSASFAARQELGTRDEILLAQLRSRIMEMPPGETRRQGLILLGNAERNRGQIGPAATAWREALDYGFEPGLAGDLAELELERGQATSALALLTRALAAVPGDPRLRFLSGAAEAAAGRREIARATWRALLADAPADAPWRVTVEDRLRALQ